MPHNVASDQSLHCLLTGFSKSDLIDPEEKYLLKKIQDFQRVNVLKVLEHLSYILVFLQVMLLPRFHHQWGLMATVWLSQRVGKCSVGGMGTMGNLAMEIVTARGDLGRLRLCKGKRLYR